MFWGQLIFIWHPGCKTWVGFAIKPVFQPCNGDLFFAQKYTHFELFLSI